MTTADAYRAWIDRIIASRKNFLYWRDDSSEEWGHVGVVWHRINETQMQATEIHFNGEAGNFDIDCCLHPPEPISYAHIR